MFKPGLRVDNAIVTHVPDDVWCGRVLLVVDLGVAINQVLDTLCRTVNAMSSHPAWCHLCVLPLLNAMAAAHGR